MAIFFLAQSWGETRQLFFQKKNKTQLYAYIYKYWKAVFCPGIVQDTLQQGFRLDLSPEGLLYN